MTQSADARERLRAAGRLDLGIWVEAATGQGLWSVQREVSQAATLYRSRVAVPSCTASGKTWLAARLALAFFDTYTPGSHCDACAGPCGGSKVITLASKFEHLRDVLWGEIRTAYAALQLRGVRLDGRMGIGQTLRLDDGPDHWIIGQSPSQAESLQGVHGAHILVIGDEATALPEETTRGLVSSLATGDARQLLIFNPTSGDTWAADQCRANHTRVIRIKAWDTPLFTGEAPPPGAYLLTPEYLDELKGAGMGPGTYDWQTKIEAEFWDLTDDNLIAELWYDRAIQAEGVPGTRALGIDLAPYGSNENTIAVRDGNILVAMLVFPSMRPDLFWEGPVTAAILKYAPHYVIYDADGVGAGVIGYAEAAVSVGMKEGAVIQLMPFRGGLNVTTKFQNSRSAWWWNLRRRFENDAIAIRVHDPKLREQTTKLKYTITANGDIRVETKEELRRRDRGFALDRGDALMYAFALTDELPIPATVSHTPLSDMLGLKDRFYTAMRKRDRERIEGRAHTVDAEWV
jgi:hypothetical protein